MSGVTEEAIQEEFDNADPPITIGKIRAAVESLRTQEQPKFFASRDGKFVPCRADGTEITLPEPTPDTTGWFKRWLDRVTLAYRSCLG